MAIVFGEIISTDGTRVKLKLSDMDALESVWVHIPQLCTVKDKSFSGLEIGTEVAAVINERQDDGCIIGAIYNDEDLALCTDGNIKTICFSDGTTVTYDKEEHTFLMDVKGNAKIQAQNGIIIEGDVNITGDLVVSKDVSDKSGSMQEIRNVYNRHKHSNGNNGSPTGTPDVNMQ